MPETSDGADTLMTRLRELLARTVASSMQYEITRLAKSAMTAASAWRQASAPTAEYWKGRVWTQAARDRWKKLSRRLAFAITRTNQRVNREQFKRLLADAIREHGGNAKLILSGRTAFVLDGPKVAARMEVFTRYSSGLISRVPRQYVRQIARDAGDAYTGKLTHKEYAERLGKIIGDRTDKQKERCARIARDQVQKCAAVLTQSRCEDNGIEEYIWKCVSDNRVAGKPGGMNPPPIDDTSRFHGDHWARNGKKFRWDDPPPDGHAGYPINCRCRPQPVIERFA